MTATVVNCKVRDLSKYQLTVTVNTILTNEFKIRAFIAKALVRAAARILNADIEFVNPTGANDDKSVI